MPETEKLSEGAEYTASLVIFVLLFLYFWREKLLEAEDLVTSRKLLYDSGTMDIAETADMTPPIDINDYNNVCYSILLNVLISTCGIIACLFLARFITNQMCSFYYEPEKIKDVINVPDDNVGTLITSSLVKRIYAKLELIHMNDSTSQGLGFIWFMWNHLAAVLIAWFLCYVFTSLYIRLAVLAQDRFNMVAMRAHIRTIYYVNMLIFFPILVLLLIGMHKLGN